MFYGNKSSSTSMTNFSTTLVADTALEESLMVKVKPLPPTIEGGAQKHQIVDVECKDVFFEAPKVEIKFKCVPPFLFDCQACFSAVLGEVHISWS